MAAQTEERTARYVTPCVNIMEKADVVEIEAEIPGVSKDGVELEVKEGELTLIGRRSGNNGSGCYCIRERVPADYRRTFSLSRAIDTSNIEAGVKNGLLTITLHKREEVKPRTIEIK